MEYDPKDNEVIHLLKKLKASNGAYPPEMLAMRRQGYLRQVAQFSGGAGLAFGLRHLIKGGKGASLPSTTGTIVEALLVLAIVAEAGAVTYFYRDQLAEFYRSFTNSPQVQEVSSPPVLPSLVPEIQITSSFVVTGTETSTSTPVGTPSPALAVESTRQEEGSSSTGGNSIDSQSAPTEDPNENNGNQYGLTPKPDRTKEPGNDISPGTQDDNTNTNTNRRRRP